MASPKDSRQPVAVYTDIDDTDVSAGIRLLEQAGWQVRVLAAADPDSIVEGAQDAEALLVGYANIDANTIAALPNLRVIALMSMGFNNVDVEAAAARGIWVTHIPGAATEEVASHSLALTLYLTRGLGHYAHAVVAGDWNGRSDLVQQRLSTQTLGLLGLGKIGRKFAEVARPTFGEIVGYDPFLPDDEETRAELARLGVTRMSLEEVRERSNVLSLHVPLTPDTEGFVDADFIAAMPRGSFVINVSRGALIDPQAVRDAVDSGHLAGAGLDVLDVEPPEPGHPLVGHPRIVVTPHIAYFSATTESEYVRIQAQNVITHAETGIPDHPVIQLNA